MLKDQLEIYINTRRGEQLHTGKLHHHYFFCLGLGVRADVKISAAEKLLQAVNGDLSMRFTEDDIDACAGGRLGKIAKQHESTLPVLYRQQKYELEVERLMRDRPEILI